MNLYWEKYTRYYKLLFQHNLFGTTDIICIWGRIGGNLGGYKVIPCEDEEDMACIIDRIKKRRKYREYQQGKSSYSSY